MNREFKKELKIRIFYLIGITILLIAYIYLNMNIFYSKSSYLTLPLAIIGLGFIIFVIVLLVKNYVRKEK